MLCQQQPRGKLCFVLHDFGPRAVAATAVSPVLAVTCVATVVDELPQLRKKLGGKAQFWQHWRSARHIWGASLWHIGAGALDFTGLSRVM